MTQRPLGFGWRILGAGLFVAVSAGAVFMLLCPYYIR